MAGPDDGEILYQCVEESPQLVLVRNNAGRAFRVNPNRFLWIDAPRFCLGDRVATQIGTPRTGWIAQRHWHFKHRRVFYLIELETANGRRLHTRRYWDDELELLQAANA